MKNNASGVARVPTQLLTDHTSQRYLLLDEPTSALDLAWQHQVLGIARELSQKHQIGVAVVLHDLILAACYADRITRLKGGRVACCSK